MSVNSRDLPGSAFGTALRHWRGARRVSQLELSLSAGVSQRHVSWLETGRSKPSREMVVQLAEALDVPLRERNALLGFAGFAPLYAQSSIDEAAMEPANAALRAMLDHHEPYPAFVIDRLWRIVMANRAAEQMLAGFGDIEAIWAAVDPSGGRSLARLTLHPSGLRPFISNWHELVGSFLHRLRREMLATGDDAHRAAFEELEQLAADGANDDMDSNDALLPVLPLVLNLGDISLRLFTMIATFGTPQDVTLDELRIELFFPADQASASFFGADSFARENG